MNEESRTIGDCMKSRDEAPLPSGFRSSAAVLLYSKKMARTIPQSLSRLDSSQDIVPAPQPKSG
jgi:hypothetical protein